MEKEAVFLLEQEAKQMQADLQREAVAAALHRAEELLASKITTADQERMAEEFLATLVPQKSGHAAGGAS
jgi:F0F1-type ATP synthase membrane subunit b/b'